MTVMKRVALLVAVLCLGVTHAAHAQAEVGAGKKARMWGCNVGTKGSFFSISDASTADSCVRSEPVGNLQAVCQCKNDGEGNYAWASVAGAEVDLSGYVLLAGDEDGQTMQGISGSDQARVDIGVTDPTSARLIGSGSTPAYVFADNQYAGMGSFGGTSSIAVSETAIDMNATSGTASIGFGTVNSGMSLTETHFEVGVGAASLNVSETAFRVVYGQTPPTNANDPCTAGDTIDTATFHYYCSATDTWVRVAMATW